MFGLGPHMRAIFGTLLAIALVGGIFFVGHHDGYKDGVRDGRESVAPIQQASDDALMRSIHRQAELRDEVARLRATTQPVTEASR